MSRTPLLGLVIPTWNAADELEATLNALRALPQDLLAPLDIVVADGLQIAQAAFDCEHVEAAQ